MKKTTLNKKLIKLNISLLAISLICITIAIVSTIKSGTEKQFITNSEGILNYSSEQLDQTFLEGENTLSLINDAYLNDTFASDDTDELLSIFQQSTSMYQHTFIVYKNGDYILTPYDGNIPETFDPRKQEWYQEALSNFGEYIWSRPYYDVATNELVITCAKAFRDPNLNETVVIGLDMTIDSLTKMVSELSAGQSGYMMLINDKDTIILHSDSDWINKKIHLYNDNLLTAEFHAKTPIYKTDAGIFIQRTLPNHDMYLIRHLDMNHILQRTIPITSLFLLLIGGFLAVAFIASYALSKRITKPLIQLKKTMELSADIDFLKTCDVKTNDEIGELIDGYNFLVNDINEKTLEMTALYEEFSASEETLQEQYDELYKNREQIKESEERFRLIAEASTQGLMELTHDNSLILHSKKWFDQFDLPIEHVDLKHWLSLIHPDDLSEIHNALLDHLNMKTAVFNEEFRIRRLSGDYIWLSSIGRATFDRDGQFVKMIASHNDITQRKKSEAEILKRAYTDDLTNLLNRSRLKEVVTASIRNNEQGTMFYIDLDNFKFLNDTYGHSYGDQVLIRLSKRLLDCKKKNCEIARISGDEFAVVIKKETLSLSAIEELARKIIDNISQKMTIDNIEFQITASVGAASYPYDATTFEDLLVNADISMHHAKQKSKNKFVIFTEAIKEEMLLAMNTEQQLKQALKNDEISIQYQPIIRVSNNNTVGFEVLARWHNPSLGMISPDIFIPIAEKNRFIIPLGDYVMKEAIQYIKALNAEFDTHYEIALNISAIQLEEPDFCQKLFKMLKLYDYPTERLNLEITESIALDSSFMITENLNILSNSGIAISLDDFGTGYSTFNNLIELPLNHLKIDKGIVQRSVTDDHVYKLIESIVEFSHKMNIEVVAEGIEDQVMESKMNNIEVDLVQGYMYSKPIDGITLRQLIKEKNL